MKKQKNRTVEQLQFHIKKKDLLFTYTWLMNIQKKTLENKPIADFLKVNILNAYQKVLTRLVDEGTNFNSHNGPIIN